MKKVLSVLITAALMLQLLAMFGAVSAEGSAAMTVTSASGTVGSTVTVDVGISNNPGFHALQCEIEYDKTLLKLVSIEGKIGKEISSEEDWNMQEPGFISGVTDSEFVYIDPRVDSPDIAANMVTGDVTIATLTFKLLETGTANVTVNCVELVVYVPAPEHYRAIVTAVGTGTVTVAEKPAYIRGDVNGNGVVDSDDAIYLLMYTIFTDDYPINQSADFNGNGVVDSDDAIYLLMYTIFTDDYPLN